MSNCRPNSVTPGTPTSSSGHTSQLTKKAIQCDTARILYRLQGGTGQCIPTIAPSGNAVQASVLEQDASVRCAPILNPGTSTNSDTTDTTITVIQNQQEYPQGSVLSSVLTQNRIYDVTTASVNPFNATTRFSMYDRNIPTSLGTFVCPPVPNPFVVGTIQAIAVGQASNSINTIQTSTNGFVWNSIKLGGFVTDDSNYESQEPFVGYGIAYNGSYWVAVGSGINQNSTILVSTNGTTWSRALSGGFVKNTVVAPVIRNVYIGRGVAWNGSYWLGLGEGDFGNAILKSTDGYNWTTTTTYQFTGSVYSAAWNGSFWLAVGRATSSSATIEYSSDGLSWYSVATGGFNGVGYGIGWNGYIWVAVGSSSTVTGTIQNSVDGAVWSAASSGGFDGLEGRAIAFNGSYWVAVGAGTTAAKTIQKSVTSDALAWVPATTGGFLGLVGYGVAWNSILQIWIAVGSDLDPIESCIQISTDGLNWLSATIESFGNNPSYGISCGQLTTVSNAVPAPRPVSITGKYSVYPNAIFLKFSGGFFGISFSATVNTVSVPVNDLVVCAGSSCVDGVFSIVNINTAIVNSIILTATNTSGSTSSAPFSTLVSDYIDIIYNGPGSPTANAIHIYSLNFPNPKPSTLYLAIPPFQDFQLDYSLANYILGVSGLADSTIYYITLQNLIGSSGSLYSNKLASASYIAYSNTIVASTYTGVNPNPISLPSTPSVIKSYIFNGSALLANTLVFFYSAPGAISFSVDGIGTGPILTMGIPTSAEFSIFNLTAGTSYTITLKSTYASGYIGSSNSVTISTLP